MARHPDVTLAILAGGHGRRLGGVVKGLLEYEGRALIDHLLELRDHFADVCLVADDASPWTPFGVRVVPDLVKDRGAPGGLHAALAHAGTPWVVLVASDMPFVRVEVLEGLLDRRDDHLEWVCAERSGYLEPMPGVYASRMAPAVAAALGGNPSLQKLLRDATGRPVPMAELAALDPPLRSWVSVNTPEDAARHGISLSTGAGR
jgi:molybdopterin-guanine dinucleotide biosynthesis protein A